MAYSPNIVSTVLFKSSNVSVFKIPPGDMRLSSWNLGSSNVIWNGSLRLIEQELIEDVEVLSRAPTKPYVGLRAKLELYREETIPPMVGSLTSVTRDTIWADIWYNPNNGNGFSIANDGEETIQMTRESPKYYKFIGQLPGSGYHPFEQTQEEEVIQVALGIKFNDTFQAISFSDSLNIYRRRFRNFQEQYLYELKIHEISLKKSPDDIFLLEQSPSIDMRSLSLDDISQKDNDNVDDDEEEDDDDDDFDDFVTAS